MDEIKELQKMSGTVVVGIDPVLKIVK
jgi:PTS system glucose-specific IIA component